MNSKVYRWCGVPQCENTAIKTPNKLFVFVPQNKTIRNKWLKLARRDSKGILPSTHLYFCEDHFDLPNDMDNYMEYHLMGSVSQIRMKPGCMPTKFQCQSDRRKRTLDGTERPYILKKQRKTLIEECQKDLEERTTKQVELEEMPCGSSGQKSGRRKQIVNERSEKEPTDCIAQIDNYEPQHVLDDSTVMMIDQPEDSATSTQEGYRLMHPLLELTCPEEMHSGSETDDAVEVIEQEVEEKEYKIDIEEHPVQEQPVSSLPDTCHVEVEEPLQQEQPSCTLDSPPEPTVPDTTDDCELNEQVPFSERAETWLSNELYTIIVNVYCFLEQEYQHLKAQCCQKCDLSPLANVARRTAFAVGVTQRSVAEALKVEKRNIISLDHSYHQVPPAAGTERVLRKRKWRTKDIVNETPVADTDGDYVLPKRKRRTKGFVEKLLAAGTERVLRKRKRRTKDIVNETSNSPSHLETTLPPEDTQPPEATPPLEAKPPPEATSQPEASPSPETTPLREDTPSPEATETEFKIDIDDNYWPRALEEATPLREVTPSPEATETEFMRDIDDNWQKAPEEDPFITESKAVVYEAPDGTLTAFHVDSEDTQDASGTDPLETQTSDDFLVKPFTTLGVDIKIEPNNEGMEPYADYSVSDAGDATPQDVKCEQPEV